jgi:hypothetical protein
MKGMFEMSRLSQLFKKTAIAALLFLLLLVF